MNNLTKIKPPSTTLSIKTISNKQKNQLKHNQCSGLWIPQEILFDKNLSPKEKLILTKIAEFEFCYATNDQLANFFNISIPTVTRTINSLSQKNKIIIINKNRKSKRTVSAIHTKHNKIKMIDTKDHVNQNDYHVNQNDYHVNQNDQLIINNNKINNKINNINKKNFSFFRILNNRNIPIYKKYIKNNKELSMKDNKKIKKPKSIALLANNKSNTNMSIKDIFKASTTKIKKKKKINYELVDKIISLFKKYNPSFKVKNINKEKSIVNSYIKKYKNNLNDNDFIRLFENSLLLFNNTSSPDTLPCCPSYWFERPNFRKGDKDTFYDWYKNKNWNKKIENSKTKILSDFEYNSRFKEEYDKIKSILKSRSNEKTNIAFINYLFDWYDKNIKQKYIYYNNKKYYYQDIMNCHFGSWKMHLNTNGSFVYFFLKFLNDRIDEKQTKENVKENEIWNPNFVNIYIAEFFNYKEISDALNKSEIHKYLVKYLKEKK